MSTSTTQQFTPAFDTQREEKKPLWRRIFDAWVRSHEARLGPNGVPFLDL